MGRVSSGGEGSGGGGSGVEQIGGGEGSSGKKAAGARAAGAGEVGGTGKEARAAGVRAKRAQWLQRPRGRKQLAAAGDLAGSLAVASLYEFLGKHLVAARFVSSI